MADKKSLTRTFETELRKLPVELVPPDPSGSKRPSAPAKITTLTTANGERGVLDRLIDRIKQI